MLSINIELDTVVAARYGGSLKHITMYVVDSNKAKKNANKYNVTVTVLKKPKINGNTSISVDGSKYDVDKFFDDHRVRGYAHG